MIRDTSSILFNKLKPSAGVVSQEIKEVLSQLPIKNPVSSTKPNPLSRQAYQHQILKQDPGDVKLVNKNGCKVYILSQYNSHLNIYRMLNYVKPSALLLQVRPDDIFYKNFSITSSVPDYLNTRISYRPDEVMPSYADYEAITKLVKKSGLLWRDGSMQRNSYKPYKLESRIDFKSVAFASAWGIHHSLQNIVLGDIPKLLLYKYISKNYTLMQLQKIFSAVFRSIGQEPDLIDIEEPEVPIMGAFRVYPDVFVKPSDIYISCVINELISKHDKLFCVVGKGQADSLSSLLEAETSEINLEMILNQKMRNYSIVSIDSSDMIVDKIALLDTLFYGIDLHTNIDNSKPLLRLRGIIESLVEEEIEVSENTLGLQDVSMRKQMLERLYKDLLLKYKEIALAELEEGKKSLRVKFLKHLFS